MNNFPTYKKNLSTLMRLKSLLTISVFLAGSFMASPTFASPTTGAKSEVSGSELFLGGNYIELGISQWGNFGTAGNKPASFFGTLRNGSQVRTKVGMSADHDGFGQGLEYSIDYFLPGTPEERFSFGYKVGGTTQTASNSELNSSNDIPTTITNTSSGNTLSATITTTWASKMTVQQKISFDVDDKFFRNEVTLTNTSGSSMDSARFMRSFDPDNTVDMSLGSGFTTKNTINYQSPTDGKAQVTAESSSVVTLSGRSDSTYPIVFYSSDADARVSLFGFANQNPYVSSAFDSAGSAGSTVTADQAINIAWQTTNLADGDSDSFVYYTSLDQRDFTEVVSEIVAAESVFSGSPSISPGSQTISGTVGTAIADSSGLTGTNFSGAISYSVTSGSLPSGLVLDSATGIISGTPLASSSDTITVTGVDSSSGSATTSVTFSITTTNPTAPTGLTATAGNGQASLSWTAGSDGGAAITDYVIEYSTDNSTWSTFSDGTSTSTSATVTGLTNGTLYYFRVKATNSVGTGSASSNATAIPAAPTSSGGGSTTPTATPTPTPTPTVTQTPRQRRIITPNLNPIPAITPRITQSPSPTPTPTQTPQAGSPTRPVELIKKTIEEVIEVLKPRIVDLNTLINPSRSPDPVASASASSAVIPLPTETALAQVDVPEEEKRVADIPSSVLNNGVPEESRIIVIEETKSQVVTGDGGLLTVEAKAGDDPVPVDSRGRVQMVKENSVETEGQGMAPESEFAVYLFSDPILLGVGKTDLAGRFYASFPVEQELPLGDHTLQVVGITPTGEQRTVAMPVVIVEDVETAKTEALPETILVDQNPVQAWLESVNYLAILMFFIILATLWIIWIMRRRKDDEEEEIDLASVQINESFVAPKPTFEDDATSSVAVLTEEPVKKPAAKKTPVKKPVAKPRKKTEPKK